MGHPTVVAQIAGLSLKTVFIERLYALLFLSPVKMPKAPITIALFIDALGWRLAQKHGFLREELPYRGPLATVFGPGATGEPTILTGLKPRDHGHFAMFTYDPNNSPFRKALWPRLLPQFLTRRGRIRRWFGKRLNRYVRGNGEFEVHDTPFNLLRQLGYSDNRDLYEPNGEQGTLLDDLRRENIPFHISDWNCDEEENLAAARRAIATGKPRLAYIFLPHLNVLQQYEGTSSHKTICKLGWYEQEIRDLIALAREHYDEVKVSVFSDHGMTDIRKECALMQIVGSLPLDFGDDYFAVYEATMARFWFHTEEAARLIGDALLYLSDGRWLDDETLRSWGCDFPDGRYGDRIYLLKPGILLNPSFRGRFRYAGMHGFDPAHEDSVAFFATNESGLVLPKGLEDLRRVLTQSVGLAA